MGADIQLYLLIEHGAILRLECANYNTVLKKSIERVRAHYTGSELLASLIIMRCERDSAFYPTEFRKIQFVLTAVDNFIRYQVTTQQP